MNSSNKLVHESTYEFHGTRGILCIAVHYVLVDVVLQHQIRRIDGNRVTAQKPFQSMPAKIVVVLLVDFSRVGGP